MNARALFLSRLKATLRSPGAMSVFLLALLLPVLLGLYSARESQARLRVAVVDHDTGPLGGRLVEMMRENGDVAAEEMDEAEARRLMRLDLLQCLFVIRPEFSSQLQDCRFEGLVDLTVAPGCAYGASVSEPLINSVMKLWFEQQTERDLRALFAQSGLPFTETTAATLQKTMADAWAEGAQVRVQYVTETLPDAPTPAVTSPFSRTALRWFAALSLLFLILSGQWIGRFGRPQLQQRLRQSGMGFARGFLIQSAPQALMVLAAFLALLMAGGEGSAARVALPALVYTAGILGLALVVCTLCADLTSLLLAGPVLGVAVAFLSGLVIELPDWGRMWVSISAVLPGRHFNSALDGAWSPPAALAVSCTWLALGVLAAWLSALRQERQARLDEIEAEVEGVS